MARRARLRLGGVTTHIIQRGVDRQACFLRDGDRARYLAELADLAPRHGCAIHAYVLMDNHVHLLVTPQEAIGVSRLMQRLGRRYVRAFNEIHGRTGTLWEGRFRSCIAEDEAYVLACHRYIELNPVRAGIVRDPMDFRWSSHAFNARGAASPLLTPHPQFLSLGTDPRSRRAAYRALFDEVLEADLVDAIRAATNSDHALGSERFRAGVAAALGRRVTRGKPGRPRRREGG
mgnify:FL=1